MIELSSFIAQLSITLLHIGAIICTRISIQVSNALWFIWEVASVYNMIVYVALLRNFTEINITK